MSKYYLNNDSKDLFFSITNPEKLCDVPAVVSREEKCGEPV